ncbi:MAG: hypothetical protein ABIG10_03240, partial [bacterium]
IAFFITVFLFSYLVLYADKKKDSFVKKFKGVYFATIAVNIILIWPAMLYSHIKDNIIGKLSKISSILLWVSLIIFVFSVYCWEITAIVIIIVIIAAWFFLSSLVYSEEEDD